MLLTKTLRSSTFKLALIAIGVFGAIVFALFSYVYISTATYVRSQSERAITTENVALHNFYQREGFGGLVDKIKQTISDQRFKDSVYLLTNPSFVPIAGNLAAWPPNLKGAKGWQDFREPGAANGAVLRATLDTLPDGNHLLVGMKVDQVDAFMGRISTAFVLSIALIVALAGMASVLVTRRTVGRIESINATSRAIMQSGLDKRIPLRGTHDEWDQVAENLNLMLDRVEALMGELKQVTDNVAHDLRTPLSRMRGRLEKAYNSRRNDEDDQTLISDTMADLDFVLNIFSSLMRISQIEANAQKSAFHTVKLVELANNVVELYDAAAEEKGVKLSLAGDPSVAITGDRDILFDALANLVDNAIKHGPPGGQVTVEIGLNKGSVVVSIADNGPGIPADEHLNVFKRFYRLERSRHTSGSGLGLSLVAAVARLHGARIEMLDNLPGLKCQIWFLSVAN